MAPSIKELADGEKIPVKNGIVPSGQVLKLNEHGAKIFDLEPGTAVKVGETTYAEKVLDKYRLSLPMGKSAVITKKDNYFQDPKTQTISPLPSSQPGQPQSSPRRRLRLRQ